MATNRNTSNNTNKNRTTRSSSSRSGSTRRSSSANTNPLTSISRRQNTTSTGNVNKDQSPVFSDKAKLEIKFALLLVVNVLWFLCMIGVIKGFAGEPVKHFLLGLFGLLAYVLPFIIFFGVSFIFANRENNKQFLLKEISCVCLLFTIGAFLSLVSKSDILYIANNEGKLKTLYALQNGGGAVFGIFAVLLTMLLGKIGSVVVDIILTILFICLFLGKSLFTILGSISDKLSFIDDYDENTDENYHDNNNYLDTKKEQNLIKLSDNLLNQDKQLPAVQDSEGNKTPILSIAEERREERELARIEKALEREKAQEEKRQRIEEKKRLAEQEDDNRIVNSSRKRNDFPLTINEFSETYKNPVRVNSKDDIHEITLISSPEVEEPKPEVKEPVINKYNNIYSADIQEIKTEITIDKKEEKVVSKDPEPQVINITRAIMPEKDEDFTPDNPTELYLDTNSDAHTESSEDDIKPVVEAKDDTKQTEEEKLVEVEKKRFDEDGSTHMTKANDTPMSLPESVTSFVEINKYKNGADISSMPEPVTEKTHNKQAALEPQKAPIKKVVHDRSKYKKPSVNLLNLNKNKNGGDSDDTLKMTALKLQDTLKTFGVPVTVTDISQGPSVTRYELSLGEGIKVSKILSLTDDIKLNLAAQDIRIEAPIPGKAAVGIEIPNKETDAVLIRDILDTREFEASESNISFAVGKDISGKTIISDIAKMPHMLIAGSTGAGKSVCINTLIMSILFKAHPDDVKLIMIDPKVVELSVYNGIPHLLLPVVTNPKKASAALQWTVNEMTRRYNDFATTGVRDLKGFNEYIDQNKGNPDLPEKMPQIVVIVDELADLMMVASKEVEESICRLAQLARAAGIHLIIATQRPSVDVITGLIKANMPSRVAFRVSSGVDSRTILDMVGAERLLGKGDMLFYPQGYTKPLRVQGAFVSDGEVSKVVQFLKENNKDYETDDSVDSAINGLSKGEASPEQQSDDNKSEVDEYFKEACRFVVEKGSASSGMLQRMYRIGFNRAARMVDFMEAAGVVSGEQGTKPRNVLVTKEQLEEILSNY